MTREDRAHLAAQLATSAHIAQLTAQLRGERLPIDQAVHLALQTWHTAAEALEAGAPRAPRAAPPEAEALDVGATVGERYRITSVLSRGRSYEAEDAHSERRVVLIVLPELGDERGRDVVELIRSEAIGAGRGDHPNVARILSTGLLDLTPWLALEQHRGHSIRHRMVGKPFSRAEAFEVVLQLAAGVQAIHEAGVIHGDLCPEVVILEGNTPKILGFWSALLAPWLGRSGRSANRRYQAPEQLRAGVIDTRTDLYSLGVIAWELLVGRPPVPPAVRGALAHAQALPEELPAAVGKVLLKMLAEEPDQRFQWARDFEEAMRQSWDPWSA
ncbi:MAG: serine/threonine protein kinase [Deltaproteobacteria bacterium]|nr:serine/threonine protein kinase [Deltaproteobacteria bacterium]